MPSKENLKVLIVDDSITVRELLKKQMLDNGINNIQSVKSGMEACEIVPSYNPDIIFLDINMPQMNGVETLSKIIEIKPDAYVIMLSSLGTKEKVNETLNRGAKTFLMKPIENENLQRILSELEKK
ncbi:MAG: response regulator [Candidatus Aureabacteria bacterium]|nr:response regulator [Candidatus Auribacterota bacterium]